MKEIFINLFAFHSLTAQWFPLKLKDQKTKLTILSGLFVALFAAQFQYFI